ncbi:tetratricopeptide repeat protein [Silvimonas sp.]|uniref:tetratricopeptide repeat protein n=1 Tax=Silvimonas sp. TaxID=2650811 RepID=UPI0028466A6E|nr:tetratricopeptide repeat protein [Silvimonas sp.]MDR3427347.1 tetratricopeptide repeat protein [Silvimonas sp.]
MSVPSPAAQNLFFEGNRQMQAGELLAAQNSFEQALELAPDMAEALANLALLQERAGDIAAALGSYRRALHLQPANTHIYLNLSGLLIKQKQFDHAELACRQALALDPASPTLLSNLGMLLACVKREAEAEGCYRQALAIDPGYAKARFNLSYILLRQGRLEEGWEAHEARSNDPLGRYFEFPRWQGESVVGKTVLIGFEAGFGDMIQFGRYALQLKAMCAKRVGIVCHPPLKTLLAGLTGIDEVFAYDEAVPKTGWDFWVPPMTLPLHCHTRLDNVPAQIPYLATDSAKVAQWAATLPAGKLRVGLVWQGNPQFENDKDRSLPALSVLAPLLANREVQFVSLQKGFAQETAAQQLAELGVYDAAPTLADFSDTAAVIANLDLVISVDSAVAHLTGALGKPCWLLLADFRTDWRWLTERSDSPWYPHMRLFRQPAGGGWDGVIKQVATALRAWNNGNAVSPAAAGPQ